MLRPRSLHSTQVTLYDKILVLSSDLGIALLLTPTVIKDRLIAYLLLFSDTRLNIFLLYLLEGLILSVHSLESDDLLKCSYAHFRLSKFCGILCEVNEKRVDCLSFSLQSISISLKD